MEKNGIIRITVSGYTHYEEGVLDGIHTKIFSTQCTMCIHNPIDTDFLNSCSKYPNGIPMEIWLNQKPCEYREY